MPNVSVNILTKNRKEFFARALASVTRQSFQDYEIIVIDDGSNDGTAEVIKAFNFSNFLTKSHLVSVGITLSRKEALETSKGEYVAILDDDDEWIDAQKLERQVNYLDNHHDVVLTGGGINTGKNKIKFRPETDKQIRNWMLFKNPFFTSTVMFRREAALKAGGFIKDEIDLAEDYDLWLRLLREGKGYNFKALFTSYRPSHYSQEKRKAFLQKQLKLASKNRMNYPFYPLARAILKLRIML